MNKSKKITYSLTLLSVMICIGLVVMFNLILKNEVQKKAENSLLINQLILEDDTHLSSFDPDEFFMTSYIDKNLIENGLAYYSEEDLYDYFMINFDKLEPHQVYEYKTEYSHMYFDITHEDDEWILYYVNIYPMIEVINQSTSLLLILMFIAVIIIIVIGINSARILHKSDEEKKYFFANASHELRTPIMSISGYAEGISKEIVDVNKASEVILSECGKMITLVDNILAISKVDSGVISMKILEMDLRDIIYETLDVQYTAIVEKGIKLNLKMDEACYIKIDESLISSVLTNIISNGLRYAKSFMNIEMINKDKAIVVCIKNDGVEIPKEVIEHIFDRFYKGENGNTGLGLSLSLAYVKLHGGYINVVSDDSGTEFIVSIPKG